MINKACYIAMVYGVDPLQCCVEEEREHSVVLKSNYIPDNAFLLEKIMLMLLKKGSIYVFVAFAICVWIHFIMILLSFPLMSKKEICKLNRMIHSRKQRFSSNIIFFY